MASVPDNYEINVAKKKNLKDQYAKHFCKILIDAWNDEMAEEQLRFFREMFGKEYNVTMTHWICRGQHKDEWD